MKQETDIQRKAYNRRSIKLAIFFFAAAYLFLSFTLFHSHFSYVNLYAGLSISILILAGGFFIARFLYREGSVKKSLQLVRSKSAAFLILTAALIAAVSFTGCRVLFLPKQTAETISQLSRILYFTAAFVWFIPAVILGLAVFTIFSVKCYRKEIAGSFPFTMVYFAIIALIWLFWLYLFWPGNMSHDSFNQWGQVSGTIPYNNWHPVFHTLILNLCYFVYPSPAVYCILQIIFGAWVTARFFAWLSRRINPAIVVSLLLIFAISPVNGSSINTIWKDIPYSISLVWVLFVLARIIFDANVCKKGWFLIETVLSLAFVGLFRHNGMIVFVLLLAAVIAANLLTQRNTRYIAVSLFSVVFIFSVNQLIQITVHPQNYNMTNIKACVPLINDILAVYHLGGEVDEDAIELIESNMGPIDEIPFSYYDTQLGWEYKIGINEQLRGKSVFSNPLIPLYIKTMLQSPKEYITAFFMRTDTLWTFKTLPEAPYNLIAYAGDTDKYYVEAGIQRDLNLHNYRWIARFFYGTGKINPFTSIWHVAILNYLCVIMMIWIILHHRWNQLLLFVPYYGNLATLLLVPYNDFRLVYPNHMMFLFLLLSVILLSRKNVKETGI